MRQFLAPRVGFAGTRSPEIRSGNPAFAAELALAAVEHVFTSSQSFAHFFRQANGRPQEAQTFCGRSAFLRISGARHYCRTFSSTTTSSTSRLNIRLATSAMSSEKSSSISPALCRFSRRRTTAARPFPRI
jgi:hypothetical protein